MFFSFALVLSYYQLISQPEKNKDSESRIEATGQAEKIKNKSGIAVTLINTGKDLIDKKKYEEALPYFNTSLRIAIEIDHKEALRDCYMGLSQIFSMDGNFIKAMEYRDLYDAIKDSVYNQDRLKQIVKLQTGYEIQKKEKEVELLHVKSKNERRILFISFTGLLLVMLLVFYSFREKHISLKRKSLLLEKEMQADKLAMEKTEAENRERQTEHERLQKERQTIKEIKRIKEEKLQEEIEHKNRTLSLSALQIVSKNEILYNLRNNIEETSRNANEQTDQNLRLLIREIDSNLNLDDEWEIFRIHFEKVHTGFFASLQEKTKELSDNDLRLSAYIKIGLDTKETARILNLSVNAIQKRKYRLRKKLQLEPEASISEYFNIMQ